MDWPWISRVLPVTVALPAPDIAATAIPYELSAPDIRTSTPDIP